MDSISKQRQFIPNGKVKGLKRSRDEITALILEICAEDGGAKKTRIVYQANLNFRTVNPYLDRLTKGDLLKATKVGNIWMYETTDKGLDVLENITLAHKGLAILPESSGSAAKPKRNRSWEELDAIILKFCLKKARNKTAIANELYIGHESLDPHLDRLVDKGFLGKRQEKLEMYFTTKSGEEYFNTLSSKPQR